MKLDVFNPFLSSVAAIAALLVAPLANAAPIFWGPAATISADTDVLTAGSLNYAYNFNNSTQTVNGVLFTGTNSTTTIGSNVTLGSGFTSALNTFGAVSGTFNGLSSAYKTMLAGGDYASGAKTITLQSLTSGRVYVTQVWVNDSRTTGNARNESFTSTGGNTVTLDYNNTNALGGVGQYSTGRFVAGAATQQFTLSGNEPSGGTQINAFQVREVTNIGNWVGTGGATWDAATTSNFASNLFSAALTTTTFDVAKAPLSSVTFADSYWNSGVATTVTQTAVTVDAAGVSTGKVYFDNSAVNYTLGNASGVTGITGTTAIVKNGSGTVTLNGANTYTGTTTITGGTLKFNSTDNQTLSGAISGSGTLTKSNTGTLTSSANNSFNGVLNIDGGTLEFTNNDAGTHNVFQSTQININNGATLKVSGFTIGSNIEMYNGRNYTFDSNGGGSILVGQGNYNANTAGFSITTNGGARNNLGVIGGGTSSAFGLNLGSQLGTFNVATGSDATSDLTVTPIIANSGSILKTGAGRLTFTAVNTYTGGTTVSGGRLTMVNSKTGSSNFVTNAELEFNITTGTQLLNGGTLSGSGKLIKTGAGGLVLGANGSRQTVNLASGSLIDVQVGYMRSDFTNTSSSINGWANNLSDLNVESGAFFDVWDSNTVVDAISGAGTINKGYSTTNSLTFGVDNGSATFSGTVSQGVQSYGGVAGGSFNLIKNGTGTQTFSGTVNPGGSITVNAGTLQLARTASLFNNTAASWTAAKINVKSAATLALNVDSAGTNGFTSANLDTLLTNISVANSATAGLQSGATLGLDTSTATGATFTQGNVIANSTGANGGVIGLTKLGTGTLVLDKVNTYTGPTNVNGGTLIVNGNISTSSLTTVAFGATLGGSGTVGATVINGTLAVGNSPGIMTFTDTLGLAGSTVMEIDGTAGAGVTNGHDFVNLTGAGAAGVLTYGGTMTLDMGVIFGVGSHSWDLFTMASETGTFTGITLADKYSGSLLDGDLNGIWDLTSGNNTWQFTESTGILDLTVAAIPEPGAALLGSLGLLALLRRRRN